jgi:chaperonin GroES
LLKPIKNNVIVELIEKEKVTSSGIVLSSADPSEANRGKVVSVGPNVEYIQEGYLILPNWNACKKIKHEDKEYYVVSEDEIVLIFGE